MTRRSVLFSPADRPDLMRKAPRSGADVVVFDLEDAVAPENRDDARVAVADVLADDSFDPDVEVCIRVNADPVAADDDLDAVLHSDRPDAVMLPKATSAADVRDLHRLMAEHAHARPVFALVETAAGVLAAPEIAGASHTDVLVFGSEDLAADIGAARSAGLDAVAYARQRVVLAAASAGIDAIDTVYTDMGDLPGLEAETREAARLGYDGKLAIHPEQVDPIHAGFEPTAEELDWARRVIAEAEEHDGVFRLDGEMIDTPLIESAKQILVRAGEDPS
jgi:citrate lyase subunit beta/citryl-CoA lyase